MGEWKIVGIILTLLLLFGTIRVFIEFFGFPGFKSLYPTLEIKVDESKNKLAILIKKNGIYDTSEIKEELNAFLLSVKNDIGIDNVGVQRVETHSLNETDQFVEDLYYSKDVGYIIMIGRDLVCKSIEEWREETPNLFMLADEKLSVIKGKKLEGPRIALSWIMAPFNYPDEDKREFVSNVIKTYTYYHNHPREILAKFDRSYLMLVHPDNYENFYIDSPQYSFPGTKVWTTNHSGVMKEMKKGHLVFCYVTHGWEKGVEFGLDPDGSETTIEEYSKFIEENGLPGLFVEPGSCFSNRPVIRKWWPLPPAEKLCCWPQANIGNGVWAYYYIGGGDLHCESIRKGFSEGPFIGYVVRRYHYDFCHGIYGDITAHMI